MSRIDRLGGYKNAKEAYEFLNSSRWHRTPEPDIEALGAELLEYRRANGIFEVGDKVIKTHPKNTILWPVLGVYKNGGVWLDYKGFCWKPPRVRHATDEEIAAGYRVAK